MATTFFHRLRRICFWLHLAIGIFAGVILFVVCLTAALFFLAHEAHHHAEESAGRVEVGEGLRLSADEILAKVWAHNPEKSPKYMTISSAPDQAVQLNYGWYQDPVAVNPYTGEIKSTGDLWTFQVAMGLVEIHRNLALPGGGKVWGKYAVGIATGAMVFLSLSGIWLWWPRHWTWRAFKTGAWFIRGAKGKTRDWNWHNVFGFWTLLPMLVLCVSGIILGYDWATDWTFKLAGDPPPVKKKGRPSANPPPEFVIAPPESGASPLVLENAVRTATAAYPEWDSLLLTLPAPQDPPAVLKMTVLGVGEWLPIYDYAELFVHPYRGEILFTQTFEDINRGGRWKIWMRWLHSGMAFGFWGELLAALISLAGCVLVWTGFALTWRRFFKKKKTT